MNANRQPSITAIIRTDYFSTLAFLAPLTLWVLYLLLPLVGETQSPFFLWLAVGATVAGLLGLGWRVMTFLSIFNDGQEAQATITSVSFFRDRGRIEYVYTYNGEKYQGGNAVHRSKQALSFPQGKRVVVLVDRNHPKRAFIRDLYL